MSSQTFHYTLVWTTWKARGRLVLHNVLAILFLRSVFGFESSSRSSTDHDRLLVSTSSRASRLFIRPGTHGSFFSVGEVRLGMHGSVLPRRHPACRNQSADGFQFVSPLRYRIRFPLGQIQAFPSFAHVTRNPPGDWRNMAVPRPISVIGVAVATSPHQDSRRL